jgi:hypothetical protein
MFATIMSPSFSANTHLLIQAGRNEFHAGSFFVDLAGHLPLNDPMIGSVKISIQLNPLLDKI